MIVMTQFSYSIYLHYLVSKMCEILFPSYRASGYDEGPANREEEEFKQDDEDRTT